MEITVDVCCRQPFQGRPGTRSNQTLFHGSTATDPRKPMKTHKNARLTFARRLELAQCVLGGTIALPAAAAQHGVSMRTARKWIERYQSHGTSGLADRSSRPHRIPTKTDAGRTLLIIQLRREGSTMSDIARMVACSVSTVSRVCGPAGLSRRSGESLQGALPHHDGAVVSPTTAGIGAPRPNGSAEDRAQRDASHLFSNSDSDSRSEA